MKLLAIDPGLHLGWALFENGHSTGLGTVEGAIAIYNWIAQQTPSVFIIEDYKIRPAKVNRGWDHRWDSIFPAKVIGAIEFHANAYNIPVILQQPAIKPVAARRAGLIDYDTKAKGKGVHQLDAYLHGMYYLHVTLKR